MLDVYILYLSLFTSYMFRCLLHHPQGDHCVTFSKTILFFAMLFNTQEVTCDKYIYIYLTYYVHFAGIKKEVVDCNNVRCGKLQNYRCSTNKVN